MHSISVGSGSGLSTVLTHASFSLSRTAYADAAAIISMRFWIETTAADVPRAVAATEVLRDLARTPVHLRVRDHDPHGRTLCNGHQTVAFISAARIMIAAFIVPNTA